MQIGSVYRGNRRKEKFECKLLAAALAATVVFCSMGAVQFASHAAENSSAVNAGDGSATDAVVVISDANSDNGAVTMIPGSYAYASDDGTIGTRVVSTAGIAVAGSQDVLPTGTQVTTIPLLPTSEVFTQAAAAVNSKVSGARVGAVIESSAFVMGNQITNLDGTVTVTVPLPAGLICGDNEVIGVYRVNADGSVKRCKTTSSNCQVQFTTDSIATYVFVVENAANAK